MEMKELGFSECVFHLNIEVIFPLEWSLGKYFELYLPEKKILFLLLKKKELP